MIKNRKIIRKKELVVLAVLYMAFTTGCGSDEKKDIWVVQTVTEGMYILCQGDKASNAKGCISCINPKNWSVTRIPLSDKQPRDIVTVGDYLCINYPDNNQIEIVDRKSFQSVKKIDTKGVWGEKGIGPRRLCHANQSIYVSFDAGYVGKLNEKTFSAEGIEQTGSFPEGMAFNHGLIVANSDKGRGNASIGYIKMLNLPSLNKMTSNLLICPTDIILINGAKEYYLDKGAVDKDGNQIQAGIRGTRKLEFTNIIDATLCTSINMRLFVVNAPKTVPATPVTFGYYDTDINKSGTFDANGLENPSAMGIDEINRHVYVACNGNGNSGYINIYTVEGQLVKRIETEPNPIAIAVSYGSEVVE